MLRASITSPTAAIVIRPLATEVAVCEGTGTVVVDAGDDSVVAVASARPDEQSQHDNNYGAHTPIFNDQAG